MSFHLSPIFYNTPIKIYCEKGWISGNRLVKSSSQASQFVILGPELTVPFDAENNPRLVSYGDTIALYQIDVGAVGLNAGTSNPPVVAPTVRPLQFSLQSSGTMSSGKPLTAYSEKDIARAGRTQVNEVIFQTATWGTLTIDSKNNLRLDLNRAMIFNIVVVTSENGSAVWLPLALPKPFSFPHLPTYPPLPPFEPPFTALTPIPPIIPMNPVCLQIVSSEKPKNVICLFKNSFCMPKWLAITVLIFTVLTILTVIAAKTVK